MTVRGFGWPNIDRWQREWRHRLKKVRALYHDGGKIQRCVRCARLGFWWHRLGNIYSVLLHHLDSIHLRHGLPKFVVDSEFHG
jgi:hypothetical protein